MEKKLQFLTAILVIFSIVFFSGCTQPVNNNLPANQQPSADTGNFYLALKDYALDMSLLGIVDLTVSNISIHNSGTGSWIVLSSQQQQFNLLELQDVQALLASKDLNAGTYNQLRFSIDKVSVDYNGTVQEAKLPSNALKLDFIVEIDANKTSIAILDFDLNKSLHFTGNGKIIMLPVIKVVSEKDSSIEVDETGKLLIREHGVKTEDKEIGTDLEGNNAEGAQVSDGTELEIDDNGKIKEKEGQGNQDQNTPSGQNPTGRLVGTIKDKKPLKTGKLDLNGLKELNITIDKITIHRPGSTDGNSSSWTELFSGEKTMNLLALQNSEALIADLNVKIGEFTQIRLSIKNANAVFDENSDQNGASYSVKVPSNKLKLTSKIIVDENKTSYFNLDFDLSKSLHVTGNDSIILKPVIKLVSKRNVRVEEQDGNVTVEDGITDQNSTQEFDENGNNPSA